MSSLGSRLSGFFSLGADINKQKDENGETREGVISDLAPELKLSISDEELILKKKSWEKSWNDYYRTNLQQRQQDNEDYWKGKPFDLEQQVKGKKQRPLSDNLIFEALETFLPVATKQNPEPVVNSDNTEEGIALSKTTEKMLVYLSDILKLKLKLKQVTRFWALYFTGVMKIAWSEQIDEIVLKPIRPQKLILDKDAIIEEGVYTGKYIGEHRKETAKTLVTRFPSKSSFIKGLVKGKMDTKIGYIEWWTDDMLFWTLGDKVLDKIKNPHWNYDEEITRDLQEYQEMTTEEEGETEVERIPGNNHFPHPMKPYAFLSVFNLGQHPHDETSLIEQNLPQQDIINKRQKQIDKNVDNINNGWVVSLRRAGLSKEEASRVVSALQQGGVVAIPDGSPTEAIQKISGNSLPADVFNSMQDARNELRGIFGTTGLTSQGVQQEKTVRGKIISRGSDSSRIGGGVAEYLEQFTDYVYNWMVQMMYVYYTEEHSAAIIGNDGAREFISLKTEDFDRKLTVSVKEGSLIPKDSLTQRNEAIDLWSAGAIDAQTLFERLEFPNPRETAEKLLAWKQGQLAQETAAKVVQEETRTEGQAQVRGAAAPSPAEGGPLPPVEQTEQAVIGQTPISPI